MAQYVFRKNIWNFDPTSIAGCTLWLDGADANTMFSDTSGTIQSTVGGSVAVWKNKSISGGTALNTITVPIGAFTVPVTGSVTLTLSSITGISQGTSVTITGVVSTGGLTTLNGTYTVTAISGNNITFPNSTVAASVTTAGTLTIAINNAIGATRSATSIVASGATSTATTISYNVTVTNSITLGLGMLVGNLATTTGISPATFNVTNAVISSITAVTIGSVYTIVVNSTGATGTSTTAGLMTFTNAQFPIRTATNLSFSGTQYLGLPNPSLLPTGSTNSTRFVVSRTSDLINRQTIFINGSNAGGGGHFLQYNVGGASPAPSNSYLLTNAFPTPFSGTQAISELHMITGQFTNFIQSGWHNGNSYPSNNNGDTQSLLSAAVNVGTAFAIVGNDLNIALSPYTTNLRGLVGNISEILVFNSALSNADRQTIEGYLAWKWGLQSGLPASHPFNNNTINPYFTPNNIGASLWYDAADSNSVFSNAVYQWSDKSGSNNHVTQSNLSLSPLYTAVNGITFNGFSNQLLLTTPNFIGGVNFTFFIVERRISTKANNYFLSGSSTANNTNLHVGYSGYIGTDVPFVGFYGNDFGGVTVGIYTTPVIRIFKFNLTTTGRTIYINGTQSGTTNATNTKLINYPGGAIGGGSQGYYQGDILEIVCYTNPTVNATSFDDDQRIEGYLAQKWGILGSLPAGHPYKTGPPVGFVDPKVSVSGCVLWLDSSDTATILRTPYWQNKTLRTAPGRNSSTAVGNPTYETNIVNGKNAFLCANNTQGIQLNIANSSNFNFTNGQISFFAVPYTTATGGNISDLGFFTRFSIFWTTTGMSFSIAGSESGVFSISGLVNNPFIVGMTSAGTNSTGILYVNGSQVRTITTGSTVSIINPVLNRDGSSGPTYFCEVIGVSTLVTPVQREQIEGYLAWKWGLQASLPATHPYALANYFYTTTRPFLRNFVPTDIEGCQVWLDAADRSTITLVGSNVRGIADKSGQGNNFSNSGATLTYASTMNNLPTILGPVGTNNNSISSTNASIVRDTVNHSEFYICRYSSIPSSATRSIQAQRVIYASNGQFFGMTPGNGTAITLVVSSTTSPSTITLSTPVNTNNLVINQPVQFTTTFGGLTSGVIYFIFSKTSNAITVTTTSFGVSVYTGITNSAGGSGTATTFSPYFEENNNIVGGNVATSGTPPALQNVSSNDIALLDNAYVACLVRQNSNYTMTVNGAVIGTSNNGINSNLSPIQYQIQFGNNDMMIGEVIIYDAALNETERQKVEGYLMWKWGIRGGNTTTNAIVPITHPFYRFPPPSTAPIQPELQLYRKQFSPSDLDPIIWIDPQDASSVNVDASTNRILTIKSKTSPTRSFGDVPITLLSVTSTSFTISLSSGLVIGSSITPLTLVAGTPGLAANTAYFVASIAGNVITVASSLANARSGIAITGFTTNASLNVTANTTIAISPGFQILSVASNVFTISSSNGLTIGTEFVSSAIAGTPGIIAQTSYYISLISGNTIRVATSLANAFNGTHMTGFTDNASISNNTTYYNFCLSKPPSISGPLLASSTTNSTDLRYMEFLNGGVFKVTGASIATNTLTLTTNVPHNIPAGRQINLSLTSGIYTGNTSATATIMGPFHVSYASVSGASGTILTLNTSTDSGIGPTNSVYLQANTATYNAGSGGNAVDLSGNYTVPANISITATSSTTGTNVVTLSSVTGLAIGQGIRFTTTFGGIPINTTHYINTISGNNITISTSPFGLDRALTTSATGSVGTAGTFGFAIVLTLPTTKTVGPIQLGDISIRNNGALSGPYIVATTPTTTTLTVTTYSSLPAGGLSNVLGRIEYGLLSLSSANLTSTTSMTIFTPIPHGLGNGDTFSTCFSGLLRPALYTTFTTATVNAAGNLLTITGLSDTTLFTTTGQSASLFIPPGTTFANGVQAASLSVLNQNTQTGTNGTTVVLTISTATANQGNLSFVTGQLGKLGFNATTVGGSGDFNSTVYTVTASTGNSFTFTIPAQPKSGFFTAFGQSVSAAMNGSNSFVSATYNSFFNFPLNGYALENTLLGGALVSRFITMVYVSHLIRPPVRCTLSSPVQSPIIATSVSINGPGGGDTGLGGRDYRIQASLNAGSSRFQLKHSNLGVNNNPSYTNDLTSTSSPFRVHSMVINTTNSNISDIAAFTKCMAVNGWRYSNVTTSDYTQVANVTTGGALITTVTGIPSTAGFIVGSTVVKNTTLGGTGAFGTASTITSINSATQITVTGTSNHTAGTIYFSVTPPNSLLNGASASTIGNILTTSYLRPTHLRIGGDTAATTNYSTSPLCGSWYEGGIADIIIYNTILTLEQRQLVEGFLAQKYAMAGITLGGTAVTVNSSFIHPYRFNPAGISSILDLSQSYTQGLVTWFDARNSSTIGFSSSNFVNSWTSAGGTLGMVLANTLSSSNWSNPTYITDAAGRPYLRFLRVQYACTTVSVDASNGILITSPNIVPAIDQGIIFNGTIAPLGGFSSYYIKSVTPVSGNNYTITVSTSVGGATATVNQNPNLVISPTINKTTTLKSTLSTFSMAPQFTTQSSNNEFTNILVFSRDGTFTSGSGGIIINYMVGPNTRITIEDGGRRCDYNLGGSGLTTQLITYGSATLVSNIPYILINYRRGRTSFTRLIGNGTLVSNTVNNSYDLALIATGGSLRMGAYDQPDANMGNSFAGGIYENMLFKYALTDQAIYQIEGYLAWKWGLQLSLPTTHPYYKIRP